MEIDIDTFHEILKSHRIKITKQTLKTHIKRDTFKNKKGQLVIPYKKMNDYLRFYRNYYYNHNLLLNMNPIDSMKFSDEYMGFGEILDKLRHRISRSSIYYYLDKLDIPIIKHESYSFIKRKDFKILESSLSLEVTYGKKEKQIC